MDDQDTRPPGFDFGWIRSARRRSAGLPRGPCGGSRQQDPGGGRGRLTAGRRHQASPGEYREAGAGIGGRDRRRARAPQLVWSVLPAIRAATRRCRSATGRSHVWPLGRLPLNLCWLVALLFVPSSDSKVVPNFPAGLRPYPSRKRADLRRDWNTRRRPRRIEDRKDLAKSFHPHATGVRTQTQFLGGGRQWPRRLSQKYTALPGRQHPSE
jgi:hypothetical protein